MGNTLYFLEEHTFLFHWGKQSYTKRAKSTIIKVDRQTLTCFTGVGNYYRIVNILKLPVTLAHFPEVKCTVFRDVEVLALVDRPSRGVKDYQLILIIIGNSYRELPFQVNVVPLEFHPKLPS